MMSEIIARAAQFGVLALAARQLSPTSFGIYGLAVAIHQLTLAVVQNGPELHATRLLAQGQGGRRLVLRAIGVKLVLAMGAYGAAVAIAWSLYRQAPIVEQVMVQALLLPIVATGCSWVLKARGRFDVFAAVRSGQAILFVGCTALFLSRTSSPLALPLAEAAATAVTGLLAIPYCLRLAGGDRETRSPLLGPSLALGFSGLCFEALWSMPVTIGGLFLGAPALGLVAGVNRIVTALNGVFQMLIQVFYPALAHRYAGDSEGARSLAGALLVYALLVALTVIAVGSAFAGPFVALLLGAGKEGAAPVMRLCLWSLAPAFAGSVLGYALLAKGNHRAFTGLAGVAPIAAALCAAIAYAIAPTAEMAAAQAVALAAYAAMLLAVAVRCGSIDGSGLSWRLLRPASLRQLLGES